MKYTRLISLLLLFVVAQGMAQKPMSQAQHQLYVKAKETQTLYDRHKLTQQESHHKIHADKMRMNNHLRKAGMVQTHNALSPNRANVSYTEKLDSIVYPQNSKEAFEYDANGNQTLHQMLYWDYSRDNWKVSNKTEDIYDDNGNRIFEQSLTWDDNLQDFVGLYKYELTYDDNSNETSSTNYTWNRQENKWIAGGKEEHIYDYSVLGETVAGISTYNKILSKLYTVLEWNLTHTYTYYYSDFTPSAIHQLKADEAEGASIYTLSGQKVNTMTPGRIYIVNGKKVIR